MKITPYYLKSERDYGVLSDVSKTLNHVLGDRSGRSISLRTAHGLKQSLGLENMHEDTAEDIVHAGMLATLALLKSDNDGANACGLFLLLGLVACYQSSK
jgi:hypothetical protein